MGLQSCKTLQVPTALLQLRNAKSMERAAAAQTQQSAQTLKHTSSNMRASGVLGAFRRLSRQSGSATPQVHTLMFFCQPLTFGEVKITKLGKKVEKERKLEYTPWCFAFGSLTLWCCPHSSWALMLSTLWAAIRLVGDMVCRACLRE